MRVIVGPMPCTVCRTPVVWGWLWVALGDGVGSLMRHVALYEVDPERVHRCPVPIGAGASPEVGA